MPKKKATFQPTVRPDWAGAMEYIPEAEQSEIFQAILMFPAIDLPNSAYWNKTIKPDLKLQFETFIGSCEKKSIGIRKRWENTKGIDMNTDVIDNYTNESEKNTNEQDMIYIVKDKDKNKDKDEYKNKFNEESIIYVNGQYFDEFPPESMPLLKKHWSSDELEDIRKKMAFKPEHRTTIAQMLVEYPPKPKKKSYGEQQKVKLTDEEYAKLQDLYGNRLEDALQKLDTYLASYNKKYASHYAVMRKGNWVYKEIFKDGESTIPDKPLSYEELVAQRGL